MEKVSEYVERYFEGTLSEEGEMELKVFLSSEAGQAPEYDDVRAVMGFFAAGRSLAGKYPGARPSARRRWASAAAIAAGFAIIATLGVGIYNKENVCVSIVGGRKVTDKEIVMNDVDNILADLLTDGADVEGQLNDIFGK